VGGVVKGCSESDEEKGMPAQQAGQSKKRVGEKGMRLFTDSTSMAKTQMRDWCWKGKTKAHNGGRGGLLILTIASSSVRF
jgi:hypothetical protein